MNDVLRFGQLTGISSAAVLPLPTAAITDATNASPIVIESVAHGLSTGDYVAITGVVGNTAANARWRITVVDADNFQLNNSTGNGSYSSGGDWRQYWLGKVIVLLQAESQNVRWRHDGTNPTTSVGMILNSGESPTVFRGDMVDLKFIEVTATAKVNYAIEREDDR